MIEKMNVLTSGLISWVVKNIYGQDREAEFAGYLNCNYRKAGEERECYTICFLAMVYWLVRLLPDNPIPITIA